MELKQDEKRQANTPRKYKHKVQLEGKYLWKTAKIFPANPKDTKKIVIEKKSIFGKR